MAGAVVVAPQLAGDEAALEVNQAAAKDEFVTSRKAFNVARKARGMARGARQFANGLQPQIDQAQGTATQALATANAANGRIDLTQIKSATAVGEVQTASSTDYVALAGGPSVTVTVPESGYIEVWATAKFGDQNDPDPLVTGEGAIALFEDGQRVPIDPNQFCSNINNPDLEDQIISSQVPPGAEAYFSTPPVIDILTGGCGISGTSAGSFILKRAPGQHTYELRYGYCGCNPPDIAAFSDRTLLIAPRI